MLDSANWAERLAQLVLFARGQRSVRASGRGEAVKRSGKRVRLSLVVLGVVLEGVLLFPLGAAGLSVPQMTAQSGKLGGKISLMTPTAVAVITPVPPTPTPAAAATGAGIGQCA